MIEEIGLVTIPREQIHIVIVVLQAIFKLPDTVNMLRYTAFMYMLYKHI